MPKAKKPAKAKIKTHIWWDWKDHPDTAELQEALKPFGVHVIEDPAFEGTDSHALLFSDRPLTKEELEKHRKEVWGE